LFGCFSCIFRQEELDISAFGTDSHRGKSTATKEVHILRLRADPTPKASALCVQSSPFEIGTLTDGACLILVVIVHIFSSEHHIKQQVDSSPADLRVWETTGKTGKTGVLRVVVLFIMRMLGWVRGSPTTSGDVAVGGENQSGPS
jgi:hypothetical protein